MDDKTTTEAPVESGGQTVQGVAVDDQGQAIPEPETPEQAPAAEQTTDEPSQDAPPSEEPSKEDNSTAEWLKNKGIDPDSPEAIEKVAEMARNAEKAMHSKAEKASKLEKSMEAVTEDAVTQYEEQSGEVVSDKDRAVMRLIVKDNIRTFFDSKPEAKQFEQAMVAELQRKPHLKDDLESLYANAVVNSGGVDSVKSQGKREALESLAHKQTAAVPRGNAVNSSGTGPEAINPQNVDRLVGQNDLNWYMKNRDAINAAMAG